MILIIDSTARPPPPPPPAGITSPSVGSESDDELSEIIKMSAPSSPFSSHGRRRRSFDASENPSNPISLPQNITITKEEGNSEAGIINRIGSPPSPMEIGSLSQALSSSLSLEGSAPQNQGKTQI